MKLIINDGGRRLYGHAPGKDCVTRAIAIITQRPYAEIFAELANINAKMPKTSGRATAGLHTAGEGIYTTSVLFKRYMVEQGFEWTPTMGIGTGCRVHLRKEELPMGRLVVSVSRHYTAVIDGVIHDAGDPRRGGYRCVYGIWKLKYWVPK